MSPWPSRLVAASVALVTAAVLGGTEPSVRAATWTPAPIPLFGHVFSLALERDMPGVVRARIVEEQRKILALARRDANDPLTRANGCVPGEFPGSLGPPAPHVTPRLLGHQVEVLVDFARLPRSLQCRPWELYVGVHDAATHTNPDTRFYVSGAHGRVVVDLAWYAKPPYHLLVSSTSLYGRRGPQLKIPLRCPGTRDVVRGCLPGYSPGLHTNPMPKPVLPIRGVSRSKLLATLDYLLDAQRRPPILLASPRSFRCASLHMCEVTYADRAFPRSRFRIRYAIAGQQISGCWMGLNQGVEGRRPYDDAGGGPLELAACASWVP